MKKNKEKRNKKGIILIEALLALTVIVVVMTALVTALVSALSSTTFSNEQTQATAYAQEGLEVARAQKNNNFTDFKNLGSDTYCLGQTDTIIQSGNSCILDGKYTREIYINSGGVDGRPGASADPICEQTDSIFVASTVSWSDSRCSGGDKCHKVELNSCFANLNYRSTP